MRPGKSFQDMTSPSFEARNQIDLKTGHPSEQQDHFDSQAHPSKHGSDTKGSRNIMVVEASFDEGDVRGPSGEGTTNTRESRNSPLAEKAIPNDHHRRGHERNLSEHFYDATSLTVDHGRQVPVNSLYVNVSSPHTSREVGKKHRRGISGEMSYPPEAHRRINSIGNSASVSRPNYSQERRHKRVDSGLDILTAAADASREELAMAAGERVRGERRHWGAPVPAPSSIRRSPVEPSSIRRSSVERRRSPVEMMSYDHGNSNTRQIPPPTSPRGHHAVYPGGHHHPPPPYYAAPMAYPQHVYGQPPPYYPPHPHYHGRHLPPHPPHSLPPHPPHSGYPIQYSRAAQQSPLGKPYSHMPQSTYPRGSPPEYMVREGTEMSRESMSPPLPVPSSHWQQGGTTQGVQTLVTTIGDEGGRALNASSPEERTEMPPSRGRHHRKTSSLSSLVFLGDTAELLSKGGAHHRQTSSTVSFLNGLDVGLEGDAAFLHHLQASNGAATGPPHYEPRKEVKKVVTARTPPLPTPNEQSPPTGKSKLALGGTSKRIRRKCTVEGCPNRVVQGGLCISHGAKRKQCKHPGCTKNVKKAGLCSTHGPARKRCDMEGCNKVAVQGGKCIAHGAKKKLCMIDGCSKQSILRGMCKKHHDHNQGLKIQPPPVESMVQCIPIPDDKSKRPRNKARGHTRGLSIFQEMSADTVGNLLLADPEDPAPEAGSENQREVYGVYP